MKINSKIRYNFMYDSIAIKEIIKSCLCLNKKKKDEMKHITNEERILFKVNHVPYSL